MSNSCNLGCHYCFQEIESNPPEAVHLIATDAATAPVKKPTMMSSEIAIEAVKNTTQIIRNAGNKTLSIEFFGGEPLLNWKTIDVVLEYFGAEYNEVAIN